VHGLTPGSGTAPITMGMLDVAPLAARVASVPNATMMSTFCPTSSAASAPSWSRFPDA
jgi:hypothetical protein